MVSKYTPLQRFLEDQPADDVVSLTVSEIARIVGGLPPSSSRRAWWANTPGHVQALAWLGAGRRVVEARPGQAVVFSPVGARLSREAAQNGASSPTGGARRALPSVMDGISDPDIAAG